MTVKPPPLGEMLIAESSVLFDGGSRRTPICYVGKADQRIRKCVIGKGHSLQSAYIDLLGKLGAV